MFRDGALDDVRDELERLGAQRAMLIVAEHDDHLIERAQSAVADRLHLVWDEIRQHVPQELAERATAAATSAIGRSANAPQRWPTKRSRNGCASASSSAANTRCPLD